MFKHTGCFSQTTRVFKAGIRIIQNLGCYDFVFEIKEKCQSQYQPIDSWYPKAKQCFFKWLAINWDEPNPALHAKCLEITISVHF